MQNGPEVFDNGMQYFISYALLLVQWLELPAWKVGDRGFGLLSGIQVSKN